MVNEQSLKSLFGQFGEVLKVEIKQAQVKEVSANIAFNRSEFEWLFLGIGVRIYAKWLRVCSFSLHTRGH